MLELQQHDQNSNYIIFVVKSTTTNYIKTTTLRANLDHIKFEVIIVATSDNRVAVIRTKSNPSTNKCLIVNRNIIRITTHFVNNR